ncbi:MAG: phage antirepressor [Clostridia bacterium]|nr:phage antirepressor [Clostridia bacterium]
MNNVTIFNFESNAVRTLTQNNEPWFVLADICKILSIRHIKDTASRLEIDEVGQTEVIDRLGRKQKAYIINESGLYTVILRSDKPQAKTFRKWVTMEVLPTIRKTGGYISNEDTFINTYLPNADEQTKLMIRSNLETIRSLNGKIEQDKPKVLFANAVETSQTSILVGDLAKLIQQNGVPMGQKRLFNWMREKGFLIKGGSSKNMPTQKAMDKGLFEVKERTISNPDGSVMITKTPKVTGKGQIYFIKKLTEVAV